MSCAAMRSPSPGSAPPLSFSTTCTRTMHVPDSLESPHKGQRGIRRLINALFYSLSGLTLAFRHESAFRQEIVLAAVLVPIACLLPLGAIERVLLIGSVLLVLIVELLNSSVEAAIDRIGF